MRWIPVTEQMPDNLERVYVIIQYKNALGKTCRVQSIAEYVPAKEVLAEDYLMDEYEDFAVYDEEKDEYFVPEGFYEWQHSAEMHYLIDDEVTHWMRLFQISCNESCSPSDWYEGGKCGRMGCYYE